MNRCLSPDELAALVSDAPSGFDQAAWEAHVGACLTCQSALLTAAGDLTTDTVSGVAANPNEPSDGFLRSLKATFTASPRSRPEVPGYDVFEELGRGGTAVVYRARHRALNRDVALKFVRGDLGGDPGRVARFRAEATAVARLRHPDVVQVYEVGEADGVPFLALEYVPGGTLADQVGRLDLRGAVGLVARVARAVQAAHDRGIVHRDLKPGNILLAADGSPKVADFGLVKDLSEPTAAPTRTGDVLGTPGYMAPEQAGRGRAVGPAADVYALGAILYELLTGRPPFRADTPLDTLLRVLYDDPVPPSRVAPAVPRDLGTVALKCLEKDPDRRYPSAAALADDLGRWLAGEPIRARPVGEAERLWKWVRRRPTVAGLAVALFAVTLAALAAVTGALLDARKAQRGEAAERREAEASRELAERSVYAGTVAQARSQWLLNNVAGAARLLAGCRPDRRGWEWHFLHSLNHADLLTVPEADGPYVFAVEYSPDGRRLAVGGGNPFADGEPGFVRVHDADGRVVWTATGLPSLAQGLAFSPDGTRLAVAAGTWRAEGERGELSLWDAASGAMVRRFDTPAKLPLRKVAFHPSGRRLAVAPARGDVSVWDADTGREVRRLPQQDWTAGLVYLPDGRVVVAGTNRVLRAWDADTGAVLMELPMEVDCVAASPDGRLLATVEHRVARVWNIGGLATGAPPALAHVFGGHAGTVLGVAFAPDSASVATAGADTTVRVWGLTSGTEEAIFRGHTNRVAAVAFHPDGRALASGGQQPGDVKVWDLTRPPECERPIHFIPDKRDIDAVGFEPDGRLTAAAVGGVLRTWDPARGTADRDRPLALDTAWLVPTTRTALAGGNVFGVLLDEPTRLRAWDADCRPAGSLPLSVPVWHTAADRAGAVVAVAGSSRGKAGRRELRVWEPATGRVVASEDGPGERAWAVAVTPDGRRVADAVGFSDGRVELRVRDLASANFVRHVAVPGNRVSALAFDETGETLAAANDTGEVRFWAADTLEPMAARTLTGVEVAYGLAFHPDGVRLAAAGRDRVTVWDTRSGLEVLTLRGARPRPGDVGFNPRVAWSPDGRRLAAAEWDRGVSVWDATDPTTPGARATRLAAAADRAFEWHLNHVAAGTNRPFHLARLRGLTPPAEWLRTRAAKYLAPDAGE